MEVINKIRLYFFKRKAIRLYLFMSENDYLDCGSNTAYHLLPRLASARIEFDKTWEKIIKLDKTAPKNPFPEFT